MSAPIIYLTLTAAAAYVLAFILARFFKYSFSQTLLIGFVIFLSEVIILPSLSNYFSFDLVHGGDSLHSSSSTKEESIKRGVYVCGLKLPRNPFVLNDSMSVGIEEAWIEKTWRRSYWFWTTIPDNGDYQITIIASEVRGNWIIKNSSTSGFGRDVLGYYDGEFGGHIRNLPVNDTLKYYVLKRDEFNFDDENII